MNYRAILLALFTTLFFVVISISTVQRCLAVPEKVDSEIGNAKAIFCGYGDVGLAPLGADREFAVVVVEINSTSETANVADSDFALLEKTGKENKFKHVVSIEVFNRPHVATEGAYAYYLNPGGTRPWKGTVPVGKIRLRIKVALTEPDMQSFPVGFRLKIGQYLIEGPVDCEWPT
jgi:hypothetical protein